MTVVNMRDLGLGQPIEPDDLDPLARPIGVLDQADGRGRVAVAEEDLGDGGELPVAGPAPGVVDGQDEVGRGRRPRPAGRSRPRG